MVVFEHRVRMKSPARLLIVAGLLLAGGFSYGFVSAKKKVFPYGWLTELLGRGQARPAAQSTETPMETGWWVEDGRPTEAEVTADLDALGYGQSYQTAGDEFGVTLHDAQRAQPGLNLVTSAHEPTALLTDMSGEVLHAWSFDFADVPLPAGHEPPGTFGMRYFRRVHLLPDGALLVVFDRNAILKLDRDGNLLWSLVGGYHHDLAVTDDGSIWTLRHDVHLVPRIHAEIPVFEDFVVELSPDGELLGEWSLLEALERSTFASLLRGVDPADNADLFHTNTLQVFEGDLAQHSPLFDEGHVLVSLWGLDTVAIVSLDEPEGPRAVWALTGLWHRQHEPEILPDGNLLVFDNMGHHGVSKVVELDPFTQALRWTYAGDEQNGFYSALCGASQRLPNGNTLITESLSGRAFEVTPENEVVWRYLSPFRVELPSGQKGVAVLMEVERLPLDATAGWLVR